MASQLTKKIVRGRKVRSTAESPQGTPSDPGSTPGASIKCPDCQVWAVTQIALDFHRDVYHPKPAAPAKPRPPRGEEAPPTTDREWVLELIRVLEWFTFHDSQHHAPHKGWQAVLVEGYLKRAREHVEGVKPVKPRGAGTP